MRHAFSLGLSILVAASCSSNNDAPPLKPAAQGLATTPPTVVTRPDAPVVSRPDPGSASAPTGAATDLLGRARPAADELERKAALIRPTAAEKRWTEIPWMSSVVEAQKVAQAEKRPLLVWISDDDPLDRC